MDGLKCPTGSLYGARADRIDTAHKGPDAAHHDATHSLSTQSRPPAPPGNGEPLVEYLHPSQRGLRLVRNDDDFEPALNDARDLFNSHMSDRRALAAVNHDESEPPASVKIAIALVASAVALLAISAAIRGVVWMWS